MFMFHNAMMLALIAMALGVMLAIWSCRNDGRGVRMAGFFGWLIILLSILAIICSAYYSIRFWQQGYFQGPSGQMMTNSKAINTGNHAAKKH
jgi:hypothetical protein